MYADRSVIELKRYADILLSPSWKVLMGLDMCRLVEVRLNTF